MSDPDRYLSPIGVATIDQLRHELRQASAREAVLVEALTRCVKYVPLVIINGRATGSMHPQAITKAEADLAFADQALATLDVEEKM